MAHRLGVDERYNIVGTQKKSHELITWVLGSFEFEGSVTIEDFYWQYLAHQACAIFHGKDFAEGKSVYSYESPPFSHKVCSLIKHSF